MSPSADATEYRVNRRKAGSTHWEDFTVTSNVITNVSAQFFERRRIYLYHINNIDYKKYLTIDKNALFMEILFRYDHLNPLDK